MLKGLFREVKKNIVPVDCLERRNLTIVLSHVLYYIDVLLVSVTSWIAFE